MDLEAVLGLLDEEAKNRAFEHSLSNLETSPRMDLEALKVCIRLRPRLDSTHQGLHKLMDLLMQRIPCEPLDSDHVYRLAEILCTDGSFADVLFRERIYTTLVALLPELSTGKHVEPDAENVRKATAYLTLLKCSYWLPGANNHVLGPGLLELLSSFLGLPDLESVALDAISAFLSLLKHGEPVVVASSRDSPQPWLKPTSIPGQMVLAEPVVDGSFWNSLGNLDSTYFKTGGSAGKYFRTWFQWISQIATDGVYLACLADASYWERIRLGLLYGYADQRKYCIGVLRQSLLAAQEDISTPTMYFRVAERVKYTQAYEQYANLFETVVLDRYLNQVQACLPELTRLLNSDITYIMASALLSASLNPLVQEGTRKIIGNWYIDYVVKVRGRIEGHTTFLLEGFLPWATVGELFTSSLVSTRNATICTHGTSLADVIARFVAETPGIHDPPLTVLSNSPGRKSTPSSRKCVVLGVLDFILDARGKIFHFATLYLLDGLIQGLKACRGKPVLQEPLTSVDVDKICRISRLPGLPEAASHLYAEYCFRICNLTATEETRSTLPGYQQLSQQVQRLAEPVEPNTSHGSLRALSERLPSLQALRKQLEDSQHRWVQGDDYAPVCRSLIAILDSEDPASVNSADLHFVLDALWEEADRRVFIRSVAVHIPSVLFHTTCIRVLEEHQTRRAGDLPEDDLQALLSWAMLRLQQLSESRTYMLTLLATSVRRAAFSTPEIMTKLPLQEYIMRFLSHPPTIKVDFLFEVAAAEKLQQHHAHRMYSAYYGQREWMAYAAMIDLIQRIPDKQMQLAKSVLDQLLQPWKTQKAGTPIISRWKNVLQLQAMLILADYCIHASDVDAYLASFRHALDLEAWPRYRFLLEWIIARIYYRFPEKTPGLLEDLANVDDHSGLQIASLMKLALLVAPRESEDFSTTFMTQLVPFSASSKVQIRHESNYAVPIIFGLAVSKGWSRITENIAFVSLNAFIRGQEKFQAAPWTIRTLRLDPVKDFKLVNIFQGEYLTIESPEKDRVAYEDFQTLYEADDVANIRAPPARVPLGDPISIKPSGTIIPTPSLAVPETQSPPAFFQTKSGFDIASLHPPSGPPSLLTHRPASVILVASLIDNPTNLGGLSRISESFGMRSLYIDDLKKTAHKDFKATSVTSEKHFPIHELKVAGVPAFLIEMKREGYEVVGIEQTDRSGVLGTEGDGGRLGTLPKKCVLVLGSEKGGISAEVLAVLDRCVEIRTVGVTRSLNVQTAGGIALYEWWREWYGQV